MPRRSSGGGGRMGRSSPPMMRRPPPPPPPARGYSTAPARPPPAAAAPVQPQQRGPGLMGQMAATAGGVAVGSAVGHVVGSALTGGGGRHGGEAQDQGYNQPQQQGYQGQGVVEVSPTTPYSDSEMNGPCGYEIRQFLNCVQNNSDITLCQGFSEALKSCKVRNGLA